MRPQGATWKGTEATLSYLQCCLYLVSSYINVSFSYDMATHFLDRPHHVLDGFALWKVFVLQF